MRYHELLTESVLDNPEFQRWFAGSKIVDRQGRPMMMFHGTNGVFDDFQPLTHFGTSKAANERLASGWAGRGAERLIPVYLRITRPVRIVDDGLSDEIALLYQLHLHKAISDADFERIDAHATENGIDDEFVDELARAVERRGFDGIVYKNDEEDRGQDSFIVLSPSQIRPAYGAMVG